MAKTPQKEYLVPQKEIDALARCLLPTIQTFFESEEGKIEFAKWQAERLAQKNEKLTSIGA